MKDNITTKASKDWTYRDGGVTVDYKAGDTLHAFAVDAAKAANAVEAEKETGDGNGAAKAGATRGAVNLKG